MAFVNASLIVGGLLMAVPVVLHLVMRRQPKQLEFPALRFLQQRRETNQTKLQLRHWLLLALRCAAIGCFALALARPSVVSSAIGNWAILAVLGILALFVLAVLVMAVFQRRGKLLVGGLAVVATLLVIASLVIAAGTWAQSRGVVLGDREAPVSAVLVFDASPRMQYRFENRTRLEVAQQFGTWLLGQLPPDSQIAVVDTRPGPLVFSADLASARKAVDRLQTAGVTEPLTTRLSRVLTLAESGAHPRKEIYVFTDLAKPAWEAEANSLAPRLESTPQTSVYVVDVGVREPRNVALGGVRLSAQSLSRNNELVVETEVETTGPEQTVAVELYLEDPDPERPLLVDGQALLPEARLRDRQEVEVAADASRNVRCRVSNIPPGVHQGYLVTSSTDSLAVDDLRYFAVEVREAWPVLVVASDRVNTSLFTEAIAPYEYRETQRERFVCTVIRPTDVANYTLDNYTAVCLLDPEPLPPPTWEQLGAYAEGGGGLAIFLGHRANPVESFNGESAQRILAATLKRTWRAGSRELFLAPQYYDHPALAAFGPLATSVPWNLAPVFRHWMLGELAEDSSVVLRFSNGEPALVERKVGDGTVLLMTTPVTDPSRPAGRSAWNELPTSEQSWPYVVLMNEMLLYLAGAGENPLNYVTGETAVLTNDPAEDPERYQLFTPLEEPQDVVARDGRLTVRFTERAGAYRLKGYRGGPVVRGFAVNLPAGQTRLTRIAESDLDDRLGSQTYQLARSREEIVREVGETRVGREFYPYLMVLLVLLLGLEQLLANRFYRRNEALLGHQAGGVLDKLPVLSDAAKGTVGRL
jgi:hypothetical protein